MAGFALYSHTKMQRFRESMQPRVISLSATAMGAPELQPLKAMEARPLSARSGGSAADADPPRV